MGVRFGLGDGWAIASKRFPLRSRWGDPDATTRVIPFRMCDPIVKSPVSLLERNMKCVICQSAFTAANNSEEHIIPNAIGGRRKTRGFICRGCNSTSGDSWDAEVARQLQPLSLLFSISRERGTPPPLKIVTSEGEAITISSDGLSLTSPKFTEREAGEGKKIYHVTARTRDEARKIVEGLKRKHPEIGVNQLMQTLDEREGIPARFCKARPYICWPSGRKING